MGNDVAPHITPTQEWYRPSLLQLQLMRDKYPAIFKHILNGGLQPRAIDHNKFQQPLTWQELTIGKRVYHIMFGWCKITHPVTNETGKTLVDLEADEISYIVDGHRNTYQRDGNRSHMLYTAINQLFEFEPLKPHPYLIFKKESMRPELKFWKNGVNNPNQE